MSGDFKILEAADKPSLDPVADAVAVERSSAFSAATAARVAVSVIDVIP